MSSSRRRPRTGICDAGRELMFPVRRRPSTRLLFAPMWPQSYDPLHSHVASTLVAALPIVVLLGAIASGRVKAHVAALLGLATAILAATLVVGMPWSAALAATL